MSIRQAVTLHRAPPSAADSRAEWLKLGEETR
jgi:hypothetical protein